MKALRRRPRAVNAPPVAVATSLPLYRALFPELGVAEDTPTVVVHVAECETAIGFHTPREYLPRHCTCPGGSGFPRTVATVRDGHGPVSEVFAMRNERRS